MAVRYIARVALHLGEFDISRAGETGTIVYEGTSDPAPISEDMGGTLPYQDSKLTVSDIGLIPEFWLQDEEVNSVEWLAADGLTRVPLQSIEGIRQVPPDGAPGAVLTWTAANPRAYEWLPVSAAPDPTTAEEGQIIGLVDGQWAPIDPPAGGGWGGGSIDGGRP